jgi:hypothetical protein
MKFRKERILQIIKEELFYREFYRDLKEGFDDSQERLTADSLASELGKRGHTLVSITPEELEEFILSQSTEIGDQEHLQKILQILLKDKESLSKEQGSDENF